jgi:hypothetical protein
LKLCLIVEDGWGVILVVVHEGKVPSYVIAITSESSPRPGGSPTQVSTHGVKAAPVVRNSILCLSSCRCSRRACATQTGPCHQRTITVEVQQTVAIGDGKKRRTARTARNDDASSTHRVQYQSSISHPVVKTSPWYFASIEYTRMYNVLLQAPKCRRVSCSLCPCVDLLLVLLGRLHIPLLDVLPLSLPSALATAI